MGVWGVLFGVLGAERSDAVGWTGEAGMAARAGVLRAKGDERVLDIPPRGGGEGGRLLSLA